MSTKAGSGSFLLCLDLELLIKTQKKKGFCACVETRSFLIFINNSRSKQHKKNTRKRVWNFSGKIFNSGSFETRQSSQFSKQNT